MEYFLAINGQQRGPFPVDVLSGQGMRPDTLVWAEGMANWTRADQIAELARVFSPPPPVPPAPATPQWQSPVFTPMPYPASQQQIGGQQSTGQQFGSPQYPPPPMQPGAPMMQYGGYAIPPNINSTKLAAGLCGIFLGALGIHKFILGRTGAGLIMLLFTICTLGLGGWVVGLIGLIEGIVYLSRSDVEFYRVNIMEQRSWF